MAVKERTLERQQHNSPTALRGDRRGCGLGATSRRCAQETMLVFVSELRQPPTGFGLARGLCVVSRSTWSPRGLAQESDVRYDPGGEKGWTVSWMTRWIAYWHSRPSRPAPSPTVPGEGVEVCHNRHVIGHKATTWGPSLHRSTWQIFGSGTVGSAVGTEKDGCSVGGHCLTHAWLCRYLPFVQWAQEVPFTP